RAHLLRDGLQDLLAPVADVHAPEAGERVEELAALLVHDRAALRGPDHVRARGLHRPRVGEGMEMVRRVETPEGREVELRHEFEWSTVRGASPAIPAGGLPSDASRPHHARPRVRPPVRDVPSERRPSLDPELLPEDLSPGDVADAPRDSDDIRVRS